MSEEIDFLTYSLACITCANINSNTHFGTHLIHAVIMISIQNLYDIFFLSVPYMQVRDAPFLALLEILNTNCVG